MRLALVARFGTRHQALVKHLDPASFVIPDDLPCYQQWEISAVAGLVLS